MLNACMMLTLGLTMNSPGLHGNRDHRAGDIFRQAIGHQLVELGNSLAARIHFADQRKRKGTVGAHQYLTL
jgi:hypothetical protein